MACKTPTGAFANFETRDQILLNHEQINVDCQLGQEYPDLVDFLCSPGVASPRSEFDKLVKTWKTFGVCCTFVLNSAGGGTVTQNGTILQAPMSQTALADGMNIAYQVNRISSVYVDFGMNPQSMLTFNFGATPGGTTIMRDWDIKVNQIPCTGPTA
eukprot:TCALIF_03427-PA protein Name:"Protein of unknown function" AED:0.41 eAED:0.41 QI:0/0/0.33/1/1/1/3/0/156